MILRRVIEHVKAQNWTAVAFDFVIVVVGVLIAFQITAWSETRAERQRETVYLSQIASDLNADLEEMRLIRRVDQWRASAIDTVLSKRSVPMRREYSIRSGLVRLPDTAPFESDDPYATIAAMHALSTLDGSRYTYRSLISAGEFRVFTNAELVRDIQAYYSSVDEVRDFEEALRRRYRYVLESQLRHGISAISPITLEEHGALADRDAQYAAELQSYLGLTLLHERRLSGLMTRAENLILAIEGNSYCCCAA